MVGFLQSLFKLSDHIKPVCIPFSHLQRSSKDSPEYPSIYRILRYGLAFGVQLFKNPEDKNHLLLPLLTAIFLLMLLHPILPEVYQA